MSYPGFGTASGPRGPPEATPVFGVNPSSSPNLTSNSSPPFVTPPPSRSFVSTAYPPFQNAAPVRYPSPRNIGPGAWGDIRRPYAKDFSAQEHQRPNSVMFVASRDSGSSITAKVSRYPNLEKNEKQTSPIASRDISRNPSQTVSPSNLVHPRTASPSLVGSHQAFQDFLSPLEAQQATSFLSKLDNQGIRGRNYSRNQLPNSSAVGPFDSQGSFPAAFRNVQVSKNTRSPTYSSVNDIPNENLNLAPEGGRRTSISPSKSASGANISMHKNQGFSSSTVSAAAPLKPATSITIKRTRSPPPSVHHFVNGEGVASQDDSERELLAKAKRLARFKAELNKADRNDTQIIERRVSPNTYEDSKVDRKYVSSHTTESAADATVGTVLPDYEGLESSNVIVGLCPDMCPESERDERERKGDLDQYERLDGDRNVTSRLLAVKKYTRTAERESSLIRPMPILQKTIDYLLSLLDQPYDDRFLGIYNFLWDRMRAIRMDLRMQHIFNQESINMLEQMIRLHIIAMHELCEYTKGEGFSEGFDAHLNIEQMNKTSVELFQMYDDHRKRGINIPTEKEFRGYYALLKLDKHPGYKVEPAELSLDLANMTPEIRQTPEVLFARNVARACRTVNFISFFRLARKSTYLQACLMHAHFAKLRTQALASLHAGLLNNQGLPVAHVAYWLGMEDDGIEDLLVYHGMSLKTFEEPYMVKDGPFLNVDNDILTKCSKLVHNKRSRKVIQDVLPVTQADSMDVETMKDIQMTKIQKPKSKSIPSTQKKLSIIRPEEVPNSKAGLSPITYAVGPAEIEMSELPQQNEETHYTARPEQSAFSFSFANNISEPTRVTVSRSPFVESVNTNLPKRKFHSEMVVMPFQMVPAVSSPESPCSRFSSPLENSRAHGVSAVEPAIFCGENGDEINEGMENNQDQEIYDAKLKLFIRLWRRRASRLRELREQRQIAANAALNLLPLGPPIRHNTVKTSNPSKFDMDNVARERYEKHEKLWARLNVSDLIAGILSKRNANARCLCWKLILCSQINDHGGDKFGAARLWLLSKLMPSNVDDDMVISFPGLTIWKKWVESPSSEDLTCCFSVVRDSKLGRLNDTVAGANAVLFLTSKSLPWKLQKVQLHNILMSIPSGASLPLLILCDSYEEETSTYVSIIKSELGLHLLDKSRISDFAVVFLVDKQQMEMSDGIFSDRRLREGLEWLASKTPLQPIIHSVQTHELVGFHLNGLMGMRDKMNGANLGPDDCISVFNEALDMSAQDIDAAAKGNSAGWPCPEMCLLDDSTDECKIMRYYLPAQEWSLDAKTKPLISTLRDSKLPPFFYDLSWLASGSNIRSDIEKQKLMLEKCLTHYMTSASNLMDISFAMKEVGVMLQRYTQLKLDGSSYYVVPQWIMIFRRLFNWRLMNLISQPFSSAYITECHHVASVSLEPEKYELDAGVPYHVNPSLDEIIEMGSSPFSFSPTVPIPVKTIQHLPWTVSDDEAHEAVDRTNHMDTESNHAQDDRSTVMNSNGVVMLDNGSNQSEVDDKASKEAAKLSKLLERCNMLQDLINEKLSVYF